MQAQWFVRRRGFHIVKAVGSQRWSWPPYAPTALYSQEDSSHSFQQITALYPRTYNMVMACSKDCCDESEWNYRGLWNGCGVASRYCFSNWLQHFVRPIEVWWSYYSPRDVTCLHELSWQGPQSLHGICAAFLLCNAVGEFASGAICESDNWLS
jgi:hypothetical protein